jgi:hypothetical protein
MKQKGPLYKYGPIHIFNPTPNVDILIKDPKEKPIINTTDDIDPELNIQWFRRLADVIIFNKPIDPKEDPQKNPYNPDNQIDDFQGYTITIIVDITDNVLKEFKHDSLKLLYYDKNYNGGQWVAFGNQKVDIKEKVAVVTMDRWIKDPPVGWGGDHPT